MNKQRWLNLMKSMNLPDSIECYDSLIAAYSEKHRFYHTSEHINAMLRHLDAVQQEAQQVNELELAIWFHDAIYKPFSSSNELDSAQWAKRFLEKNGFDKEGTERIYSLIMVTKHDEALIEPDEKLIVDIDLTILGTSSSVYEEFELNVRKEYRWVPWFLYRSKRKQLLQSFLDRDCIYSTEYFNNRFEKSARENIRLALENI
jgi:predicted metal-dependent HD superfamily phosphohydrolase